MGINKSIVSGVSLFQGFKNTGVQEYKSSGVPDGNSIIIMSNPVKGDNQE